MKSADIKPGIDYAVRLPATIPYPHVGGKVVRARATSVVEGRKRAFDVYPYTTVEHHRRTREVPAVHVKLTPQNVVSSWSDHEFERAWSEAIRADEMRDYDLARKAEGKRRERFIAAFDGIMVSSDGLGRSGNVKQPDLDLGDYLRDVFVKDNAAGTSFGWETFEAVAARLLAAQRIILDAGGNWGDGPQDTGIPEVVQLPPRTDVDALLARIEELEQDARLRDGEDREASI